MTIDSILAEIDAEIARLTQAKQLLAAAGTTKAASKSARTAKPAAKKALKRVLSPEARKRIAEAQRRRWAAQKGKSKKES
jgi:hypothetical protein